MQYPVTLALPSFFHTFWPCQRQERSQHKPRRPPQLPQPKSQILYESSHSERIPPGRSADENNSAFLQLFSRFRHSPISLENQESSFGNCPRRRTAIVPFWNPASAAGHAASDSLEFPVWRTLLGHLIVDLQLLKTAITLKFMVAGTTVSGSRAALYVMKCFSKRRFDRSAPSSVSITDFALLIGSSM
jgi:hypothetical protein